MAGVGVRYLVRDVAAATAFYTEWLGFSVEFDAAPGFAVVTRAELRLMLNAVGGLGGASQPVPDGQVPEPGGSQVLLEDPSGLIELFQPA